MANYTLAEASLLCGISASKLRRWIRNVDGPASTGASRDDDGILLDFGGLAEAAVAAALSAQGATNRELALVVRAAREAFGVSFALACKRFLEEGGVLVAVAIGDDALPAHRRRNVLPVGYGELEHDDAGLPVRWWPKGRERGVLVDPSRCGGRPIEATTFVPITPLVSSVGAEGSVARAAAIWDVDEGVVRRALAFQALYGSRALP